MFITKVFDKISKLGLYKCPIEERIDSIIDVLKNLGAGYMGVENYQSSLENY